MKIVFVNNQDDDKGCLVQLQVQVAYRYSTKDININDRRDEDVESTITIKFMVMAVISSTFFTIIQIQYQQSTPHINTDENW